MVFTHIMQGLRVTTVTEFAQCVEDKLPHVLCARLSSFRQRIERTAPLIQRSGPVFEAPTTHGR